MSICVNCKQEFFGHILAQYCSSVCRRERRQRRAAQYAKARKKKQICTMCGTAFTGRTGRSTCSEACAIRKRRTLVGLSEQPSQHQ